MVRSLHDSRRHLAQCGIYVRIFLHFQIIQWFNLICSVLCCLGRSAVNESCMGRSLSTTGCQAICTPRSLLWGRFGTYGAIRAFVTLVRRTSGRFATR